MSEVINLGLGNSIFNQFIAEIRDVNIQKDRMRLFRSQQRQRLIKGAGIMHAEKYHG